MFTLQSHIIRIVSRNTQTLRVAELLIYTNRFHISNPENKSDSTQVVGPTCGLGFIFLLTANL